MTNNVVAAIQLDLPLTVDGCVGLFLTFEEIDLTGLVDVEAVRHVGLEDWLVHVGTKPTDTAHARRHHDLVYVQHVGRVLVAVLNYLHL
ncbi:hypothetical protein D3C75_1200450 [compost metagenome]